MLTLPALPAFEKVSMAWVAVISPCWLVMLISPPVVGLVVLRALASSLPVVMLPMASIVILPEPSGERELIVLAVVSIVPLLLFILMSPAKPWVASPSGLGMRVKLLLSLNSSFSLTKPDARSI